MDKNSEVILANVDVATGATFTDAASNYSNISGAVHHNVNLSASVTAVENAYSNDSTLAATQTFSGSKLNAPLTVQGTAGVNVIDINGNLTQKLTLNGPAASRWVVNVTGQIQLNAGAGIVTTGGVHTDQVIIDYESSKTLQINSAVIDGNIIDPLSAAQINMSTINGNLYFGSNQTIAINSGLITAPTPKALSSVLVILGAVGGFGLLQNAIRRNGGLQMLKLA